MFLCYINQASDFGPCIAHFLLPIVEKGNSNFLYAWTPIVEPIIGGSTTLMVHIPYIR
ncbi:hypothetical protein H8697_13935 [[Eubacterium] tenue]|nr:hypothetical protein [[Eubacterium] tenue]